MKKQAFIIFILLVLILLFFNKLLMGGFDKTSSILDSQDLLNTKQVDSQRLFDGSWKIIKHNFIDASLNKQNWDRWKKHYKGKIKTDEDADVAINTMLASLNDPYSRYLSKKDYADQNTHIDSKVYGVGVNISSIDGKIYVVGVVDDSPAADAKIEPKDIIIKVGEKDVRGMRIADVASIVRGPAGTKVVITLLRGNKKIVKTLKRREIKIKTVKSSIEKNIGYIQIMSFIGATTSDEFVEALQKTKDTNGLIIDLRGNTGGLLPNAVFIANLFVDQGNLVSIVGRNGFKHNIYAQDVDYTVEKPLLVLIDGASASASEILSGVLKDYHRAKLVGTKTFGKGMVQKIIPMPNETGLDLTIAKYLTPAGHDINKIGIQPDIEVKLSEKDFLARKDVQLEKAKLIMSKMIKDEEK